MLVAFPIQSFRLVINVTLRCFSQSFERKLSDVTVVGGKKHEPSLMCPAPVVYKNTVGFTPYRFP